MWQSNLIGWTNRHKPVELITFLNFIVAHMLKRRRLRVQVYLVCDGLCFRPFYPPPSVSTSNHQVGWMKAPPCTCTPWMPRRTPSSILNSPQLLHHRTTRWFEWRRPRVQVYLDWCHGLCFRPFYTPPISFYIESPAGLNEGAPVSKYDA